MLKISVMRNSSTKNSVNTDNYDLDELDYRILDALQLQADCTVADISKGVGLSHTPCWRRLKRLETSGYLARKATILDHKLMGFGVTVIALVSLRETSIETMESFKSEIKKNDQVLECYEVSGERNFLLKIVATDLPAYDRFLKKTLIHMPHVVSIDSIIVLSEVKHTTRLPIT